MSDNTVKYHRGENIEENSNGVEEIYKIFTVWTTSVRWLMDLIAVHRKVYRNKENLILTAEFVIDIHELYALHVWKKYTQQNFSILSYHYFDFFCDINFD